MDLQRRIKFYLFGAIIGIGLAYVFFGDRLTKADWLPEERIKKRLSMTLVASRPMAREQLNAWPAELSDLRNSMMEASVDLQNSTRTSDSIYYDVNLLVKGRPAHLVIAVTRDIDSDTTATLWMIAPR